MYIPQHFKQRDQQAIHDLIEAHALAILVTDIEGRMQATHVPVVLDREHGSWGRLRFHLARANPVSRVLDGGREVLMIFSGPQCYVSPDWYDSERQVPTWNYAAVHVYGKPAPMDDATLCRQLDDLSASQETRLPKSPWTTAKLPQEHYERMRSAIAGFAMPIDVIEGKWKMNQNRQAADRQGVIVALTELAGDDRLAVAAIMKDLNNGDLRNQ
jgi:transcriptional regulator